METLLYLKLICLSPSLPFLLFSFSFLMLSPPQSSPTFISSHIFLFSASFTTYPHILSLCPSISPLFLASPLQPVSCLSFPITACPMPLLSSNNLPFPFASASQPVPSFCLFLIACPMPHLIEGVVLVLI